MTLSLKDLAKVGAQVRLTDIQSERDALLQMFPELREGVQRGRKPAANGAAPAKPGRKRGSMSAAQRKEIGARMKAYWAARRAAKSNGASEGAQSEAANHDGSSSRKSGRRAGRKQGRKK